MASYSAIITSAEVIIAAASRFVDVPEEEINLMKENAIPRNTKHATKFGMTLFKSKMKILLGRCMRCIMQMSYFFLSKPFANSLNRQKQREKMFEKRVWRVRVVDKSTDHDNTHFHLFFTTISTSKNWFFFQSAS